jgi:protein-S-isoprenylcysteine O-methyltransferase Ste14
MSVADLQTKLPRFTVPTIVGLLAVSLLYSVLVTANITLWLAVWGGLLSIGIGLFVVYLFYRLVLAVERIADNL